MPHVVLRPVRESDLEWIVNMQADRHQVGEHNWSGEIDVEARLADYRARLEVDGFIDRAKGTLVVEVDGDPAGDVTWRTEKWGPSEGSACPSMGIALLPEHRGFGHGTVAQRLIVEYLFRVHDAHRVQSDTAADNPAEQRSLEKAGFQREGVVRDAEERDGRHHDHILYSVIRSEWTPDDSLVGRFPSH